MQQAGRTLILLSCSRDKIGPGKAFDSSVRSILRQLPEHERDRLTLKRAQIFDLLKGKPVRLYDEDGNGGYRDERAANRRLVAGPDFGGSDGGSNAYLPAHERYCGRFFSELETRDRNFWPHLASYPIEIVFVSGLYGLVLWDEMIQDYDCHFADFTKDHRQRTVGDYWGDILTFSLCTFVKSQSAAGRPFSAVYDLLSEYDYQSLFDWQRVASAGVQVYHRIFLGLAGPDILVKLAAVLADQKERFYGPNRFESGRWYDLPGTKGELPKIGFERRIGEDVHATREDTLKELESALRSRLALPEEVLKQLALAEHSWEKVRRLRTFDFGSIIVAFTKAVEQLLYGTLDSSGLGLGQLLKLFPDPWNRARVQLNLKQGPWELSVSSAIRRLAKLRNEGGAHPGQRTRLDAEEARALAFGITEKIVELGKKR